MNLVTIRTYGGVTTRMLVANDDSSVNLAAFCLRLDTVGYVALDKAPPVRVGNNVDEEEMERGNNLLRAFHFNLEMEESLIN